MWQGRKPRGWIVTAPAPSGGGGGQSGGDGTTAKKSGEKPPRRAAPRRAAPRLRTLLRSPTRRLAEAASGGGSVERV